MAYTRSALRGDNHVLDCYKLRGVNLISTSFVTCESDHLISHKIINEKSKWEIGQNNIIVGTLQSIWFKKKSMNELHWYL